MNRISQSPHESLARSTSQNFYEHLDELRHALVKIILAVLFTTVISYYFVDNVLAFIVKPVGQLVFTSPGDAFVAQITLAIFVGCISASPYVFYEVWKFVASGLREEEKRFVNIYGPLSVFLFVAGGLFAYFITIPISLEFLLSFSSGVIQPMITIKSYISFVGTMILAFGVMFELPLVLMFLAKIGIATPTFLSQKRRHAIVIILIISAFITPPDIITQLILAGPLIILYELGILATRLTYRG